MTPLAPDATPHAHRCLNCGHALADPRPRFCGHCGQETNLRPPRFTEFVQQFGGAYFSTEGALWRTLALLLRPGELTRRYLAGRRKHYVLPLRLFITISLITLLVLRLNVPSDIKLDGGDLAEFGKGNATILDLGNGSRAGVEKGRFFCENLPAWFCGRLEARLDVDPKSFARELKRLPERFISHWGTAMFLLVPLFALMLMLVYLGRGLRYTEHLVFALHLHSFWFIALALSMLSWSWVAAVMSFAVPLYTLVAARRVYGGGWITTLLRAFIVFLLYSIVLGVAVGVVMIWAFFS